MKVAIIGSRFSSTSLGAIRYAREKVRAIMSGLDPEDDIVTGDAPDGVDAWVVRYLERGSRELTVVKPAWARDGRAAGPIRNVTIAKIADRMIAVWDGKSKGTKSAIDAMQRLGKPVEIVVVEP